MVLGEKYDNLVPNSLASQKKKKIFFKNVQDFVKEILYHFFNFIMLNKDKRVNNMLSLNAILSANVEI